MSDSRRKAAARLRMSFTGECFEAARSGIDRDNNHGLDTSSAAQRDLRALLAIGFGNSDSRDESGAGAWGVSTLSAYTITVSPRFHHTVLVCDAPDNVLGWLLGLPGLRLRQCLGYGTFVTRHLPTSAELVVTSNKSGKVTDQELRTSWRPVTIDRPVTDDEDRALRRFANISDDAKQLLAAIFCRISAADPNRRWAIGNWFYDPLVFHDPSMPPASAVRNGSHRLERHRRLFGSSDSWTLSWSPYPYAEDLIASMTAPDIGLRAVVASTQNQNSVLTYGSASLTLDGPRRKSLPNNMFQTPGDPA